ncbi:hypothetical protein Misp01_56350 [Microtetraspora sp. NBRC 13810]|nr:hypothetical protein Misp01_56350 [Microtetraspora sp. NBRC 13810]
MPSGWLDEPQPVRARAAAVPVAAIARVIRRIASVSLHIPVYDPDTTWAERACDAIRRLIGDFPGFTLTVHLYATQK